VSTTHPTQGAALVALLPPPPLPQQEEKEKGEACTQQMSMIDDTSRSKNSGSLPQSSSGEAVVTSYHGWNPRSEGACRGHHRGPFLDKKVKMAEKTGKEGHNYSYLWKTMKGLRERAGARCPATYTTKDMMRWPFMNCTWDRVRHARNYEWFATSSTRCRPRCQ
jgi:hypothetical protein